MRSKNPKQAGRKRVIAVGDQEGPPQQQLLRADGSSAYFPCPSCRGNLTFYRPLYQDEIVDGGPDHTVDRCRSCQGTGTVPFDPDDKTDIPY